ncbi:hypothetical protein [Paenibacillus popilliae]|uniref:hypothetical protein n=1 Tax=Paenibacillus popilliae TaxID=78057 RepID=UPI0003184505|nr:hypothetical protein [Paenibacillus popilliae]
MTTSTGELKQWMNTLNRTEAAHILEDRLLDAQSKNWSCGQFLHHLLKHESHRREEKH